MATPAARALVERLLAERQGGDMRFDLDCRVEVWVTAEEIAEDPRASQIANGAQGNTEGKIAALKNLAQTIAAEKLNSAGRGHGIEITCDSLALSSVNIDRIDWTTLALSDAEKQAAEDADEADYARRFPK